MITYSDIREQSDGYKYDSFCVAPPGTFGHPSIDQGPREPAEGWLDRARQALTGPRDVRFERLVARFNKFMLW